MEELKDILGECYDEVMEKIAGYNSENGADVVLADVGGGKYVSREDADAELNRIRLENAVDIGIRDSGARNPALIVPLLDFDKLGMDGGGLHGLSEQLDELRRENPFLFARGQHSTGMRQGGAKPAGGGFFRTILDNQVKRH